MANGTWKKDTYLIGVPESEEQRASMTFDMLDSIDKRLYTLSHEQPAKCKVIMDDKIKTNNKVRRRFDFGIGGGSGLGAAAIFKVIWAWFTGNG